jgi:hypothetical protein
VRVIGWLLVVFSVAEGVEVRLVAVVVVIMAELSMAKHTEQNIIHSWGQSSSGYGLKVSRTGYFSAMNFPQSTALAVSYCLCMSRPTITNKL